MRNTETKSRFDAAEFEREYHYDGMLGALCGKGGTQFALWSPMAQRVTLLLYRDSFEWTPYERIEMTRTDRGVWRWQTDKNLDGAYYGYEVTADGQTRWTGDPYARACGLNGWRSMVIDLERTNPPGWAQDRAPKQQRETIIYETHVGDFSWDPASGVREEYRGKYPAFTQRGTTCGGKGRFKTCTDYIASLGVTHVQLMPVYDFGSVDESGSGGYNWGYDPVNYNVPEGSYSTDAARGEVRIREFKEMILALHRAGLRVIMDVVYNHTYNLDVPLFKAAPWYHYRQTGEGWPSNGSGCGNEVASERSMCARYILDSVLYWAEEYHIDGFRFDLMGLLDVPLMNRIRSELDARYGAGEKLLLGEPWSGGTSAAREGTQLAHKGNLRLLHPSVGAFCDNVRDAVKGSVWDAQHRGFVNGAGIDAGQLVRCIRGFAGDGEAAAAPAQSVIYNSAHDDWTLWDKLIHTLGGGKRFAQPNAHALAANRLAAAIAFCCQGRLFLLSGEEFARTKLGVRNSYRTSIRINRLDWKRARRQKDLVNYYRGLIALRKRMPGLCDKGEAAGARVLDSMQLTRDTAAVLVDNRGENSMHDQLLLCFNAQSAGIMCPLPEGTWDILADGEDSFRFMRPQRVSGEAFVGPVSCLILGRQPGSGKD